MIVAVLRGQILLEKKDTKPAHEEFVTALKADSSRHDAYLGLASVYLMRGQAKHAQAILDDAVRADPHNPEAYGNLPRRSAWPAATTRRRCSTSDEVIRLSPGSACAYNERGVAAGDLPRRELPRPRQAVELATRAGGLTGGKNPRYLATLAAACSETGDFKGATAQPGKGPRCWPAKAPEKAEYRRLLDRYRMKKPHHHLGLLEETGHQERRPAAQIGPAETVRPYDPAFPVRKGLRTCHGTTESGSCTLFAARTSPPAPCRGPDEDPESPSSVRDRAHGQAAKNHVQDAVQKTPTSG